MLQIFLCTFNFINLLSILLKRTLRSMYTLITNILSFVTFLLNVLCTFVSLAESRTKFQGKMPIKYSLNLQTNVLF